MTARRFDDAQFRFGVASVAAAAVAAGVLPQNRLGLGLVVVAALVTLALAIGADVESRAGVLAVLLGLALTGMAVLRDATWLVLVDVAGAIGIAVVALSGATLFGEVARAGVLLAAWLPRGVLAVMRPLTGRLSRRQVGAATRATALTVLLVTVFGVLFVSADAAFADLTRRALEPYLEFGLWPARWLVFFVVVALAGTLIGVNRAQPGAIDPWATTGARRLAPVEWGSALVALDVLFAAFVAVQVTVLFGGRDHVVETAGLTFAQYARQGFFQLVAVAALTLAVVGGAVTFSDRRSGRDEVVLRALLAILLVLTLVILASALKRLTLYEETFGFTRLRIAVHATILWIAAVLVLTLLAGAVRRGPWLARAVVVASAVGLIAFNLVDPEAVVAERNVERYRRTGKIDVAYVSTLGADAVPALLRLPAPLARCALAPIHDRLRSRTETFWSFNVARDRARRTLAGSSLLTTGCSE